MKEKMEYRPDVDGLRAIAVIAVILYHAGIKPFTGGFVGVDVFFVISGFLITSQIAKEIRANEFSFISFYERRIRRIFPAFFTVTIFVLLMGAWFFDPDTYKEVGRSAIAATLSLSNIFFWSQAGYFDAPSMLKPMLHAWSLSVEEQFYLFLPILLFLFFRFIKSKLIPALIFVLFLSFALNVYILYQDPNSAYFLAHLRAWELLFGSLIALKPIKLKPWILEILSLIGLAMILVSTVVYSQQTMFPGAAALIPVLGAALLINSGVFYKSFVAKILGTPPFVFIGKISYSLYLWHWPLIVFAKYYLIREITNTEIAVLMAITLLLSVLSWRFVEIPFRSKKILPRPRIFIFAGSVMTLIIGVGISIFLTNGFPNRFADLPSLKSLAGNTAWQPVGKCAYESYTVGRKINFCNLGKSSHSAVFLLFGDSHARALAPAVNRSATKAGVKGLVVTMSGCPPLVGISRTGENNSCPQYNDQILNYIKAHPEIKTILLSARWVMSANGTRYKTEDGPEYKLINTSNPTPSDTNASLFEIGLFRTIDELLKLNRQVIIVSEIPEIGYHVPSAFSIAQRTGRDLNNIIAPTLLEYQQRNSVVLSVFEKIRQKYKLVQFVDLTDLLCKDQKCQVTVENRPLYRDDDHLSAFGASFVSNKFDSIFNTLSTK